MLDLYKKLEPSDPQAIRRLHLSLMQLYGLFTDKHGGITEFAYKDSSTKMAYLESLLKAEIAFNEKGMFSESVAAKMLGLVLANTLDGTDRDMKKVLQVRTVFEHFRDHGVIDLNAQRDQVAMAHVPRRHRSQ